MLFEGGAEAADEGVEAAPGLAEGARAGGGRVWVAEKGAHLGVDFGLSELVKVAQKFQNVGATAAGEGQWGPVVSQILPKGVPVAALLVLVSARSRRGWRRSCCC